MEGDPVEYVLTGEEQFSYEVSSIQHAIQEELSQTNKEQGTQENTTESDLHTDAAQNLTEEELKEFISSAYADYQEEIEEATVYVAGEPIEIYESDDTYINQDGEKKISFTPKCQGNNI